MIQRQKRERAGRFGQGDSAALPEPACPLNQELSSFGWADCDSDGSGYLCLRISWVSRFSMSLNDNRYGVQTPGSLAQHMRGKGSPTNISNTRMPPISVRKKTIPAGSA